MDAWDRVAEDGVEGGEEKGVRGRLHNEQGGAQEQDLQCRILRGRDFFLTRQNVS